MKIIYKQTDSTAQGGAMLDGIGVGKCYLKYISGGTEKSNFTKKVHHHTGFEVHILLCGEQKYEFSEEELTVSQGEMLVIFKEREIYYTYYVAGETVDAESVINQNVIDLAANSVVFPVIQIHSEIGCDCPNTVALCQNRLVWATSAGRVYTLATNNQYSERNVVEISALLGKKMREIGAEQLKTAYAADCDEHYYLSVGKKMFVLDYGNNGLSYMASYGGYDNAVKRLAWYIWEMPFCISLIFEFGQKLLLLSQNVVNDNDKVIAYAGLYFFDDSSYFDNVLNYYGGACEIVKKKIFSMLQTKMFDFARPECKKKIEQVYICLGKCTAAVTVGFNVGKNGFKSFKTIKRKKDDDVEMMRVLPKAPHVSRFGLKLQCDGVSALESVSINYKLLGSVK